MSKGGEWPAGWYPDPHGQHAARWWDGRQWTAAVSGSATPPPPVAPMPSGDGAPRKPRLMILIGLAAVAVLILGIIVVTRDGDNDDDGPDDIASPDTTERVIDPKFDEPFTGTTPTLP